MNDTNEMTYMDGIPKPSEIFSALKKVHSILREHGVGDVTLEELFGLFDDWDANAMKLNKKTLESPLQTLHYDACRKIDDLLASISDDVEPGGLWWGVYKYPTKKGHGLFTFPDGNE